MNAIGKYLVYIFLGRNKAVGVEWGFQVRCQKYSKHAKLKCNNWESDNYNRMVNTAAADEEEMFEQEGNSGRTRR